MKYDNADTRETKEYRMLCDEADETPGREKAGKREKEKGEAELGEVR